MRSFVLVFVAACSQTFEDDVVEVDARAFRPDATAEASFGDANAEAEAEAGAVFNGGGPFLCGDCACDGTLYFCDGPFAGDGGGPGDAEACSEGSACTPIPIACLPKPTCACLDSFDDVCSCAVDPSGEGLVVTCE